MMMKIMRKMMMGRKRRTMMGMKRRVIMTRRKGRMTIRMMVMTRMTRRIMMVVAITSFFEVAVWSEMDGTAPMTSPIRAQLAAILQVFLWENGEHKIYELPSSKVQ